MKLVSITAAAALLVFPTLALGLGTESFGNAPAVQQPGWAAGVLEVVNLESRVYSQWVNGNENFFYKGDARALNEAIRKYSEVKAAQSRLVLLPGRGKTRSFGGKAVDFDWHLHVPSGIYQAVSGSKHAILTAHINARMPSGPLDRKKADKWLRDLDDDAFETRQAASRELEKLGAAAKPLLREALKARPSPEVRRRISALLAKLPGIDAGDLEVPEGVTVVTAGELLKEHLKALADADPTRCAIAMYGLVELAPYSDKVVPALTGMLEKGKKEYVRRVAASYLGHVGAAAKSALPALREGLGDPDVNVRLACGAAIEKIENAKVEPGWEEEVKRRLAILKDIERRAAGK